jgi:two-component system response regulator DevR
VKHRTRPIRVVIVDDHEMVLEGLKVILADYPDIEVVGEASRGAMTSQVVRTMHPDVLLLDARLPDISGPEVIEQVSKEFPQLPIVVLSSYTDRELVEACIRAGAKGYVVKDVERFGIVDSIRRVNAGQTVLSPQVAGSVVDMARSKMRDGASTLNRRQLEILQLIARGYSNREIAQKVHLSENTIKTHVQSILSKLQARNRVEAAILAARRGLI